MNFSGFSDTQLDMLSKEHSQWNVQQIRYGKSQIPIIIIDNFSKHAHDLIQDSKAQKFQRYGPYYPGVQAHAPADYLEPTRTALTYLLTEAFNYQTPKSQLEMCMYSYVTTRPDSLTPLQRYPHYDGGHPHKIALLHYLCDASHGGTQFYRHDRTGFETIAPERRSEYIASREDDIEEHGLRDAAYFTNTEHGFTCLEKVEARFNRAVLYPSSTLHSGEIGPSPHYTTTPEAGRLTVNTFFVPEQT